MTTHQLIESHVGYAASLARAWRSASVDPDEATSTALEALCVAAARYQPRSAFTPFAKVVIQRSIWRRNQRRRDERLLLYVDDLEGSGMGAATSAASPEVMALLGEVLEAVCALPPRERRALQLTAIEGATVREAAEELAVPEGTVKSLAHRARKRLKATLGLAD